MGQLLTMSEVRSQFEFDRTLLFEGESTMKTISNILIENSPVRGVFFATLKDKYVQIICTHAIAAEFTFENGFCDWEEFERCNGLLYTSSELDPTKSVFVQQFGIDYAIRHVYTVDGRKEIFGFCGAINDKSIVDWYHENYSVLSQFEIYFSLMAKKYALPIVPKPEKLAFDQTKNFQLVDLLLEQTMKSCFNFNRVETHVLKNFGRIMSLEEIAKTTNASRGIVERHLKSIRRKLNIDNDQDLLSFVESIYVANKK